MASSAIRLDTFERSLALLALVQVLTNSRIALLVICGLVHHITSMFPESDICLGDFLFQTDHAKTDLPSNVENLCIEESWLVEGDVVRGLLEPDNFLQRRAQGLKILG